MSIVNFNNIIDELEEHEISRVKGFDIHIRMESGGRHTLVYIEGSFPDDFDYLKFKKILGKKFNVNVACKKDDNGNYYYVLTGKIREQVIAFLKELGLLPEH
jgi:translation initiation factor 1 (eIF-1/SUI1)